MIHYKTLTRRKLLSATFGALGASTLSSYVPRLEAAEGDATPARFFYYYACNWPQRGIVNSLYQNSPGPLAFPESGALAPLNSVAEHLLLLRGMGRPQANAIKTKAGPHPAGAGVMLTGTPPREGVTPTVFDNKDGSSKRRAMGYGADFDSVDQYIGKQLADKTAFSDLAYGTENHGIRGPVDNSLSIRNGAVRPREQRPEALFNQLVQVFPGSSAPGAATDWAARRRSVLDMVRGEITSLQTKVSVTDRARLDEHLQSIRAVEDQLAKPKVTAPTDGSCTVPEVASTPEDAQLDVVMPLYRQLLTIAFRCDATRVAGCQVSAPTSATEYLFLDSYKQAGLGFHSATHEGGKDAYIKDAIRFHAQDFADLMQSFKAVTEPDGTTMLDNVIAYWSSDVGYDHEYNDIFSLIGGGAKRFKVGQMQNVKGSTAKILAAIPVAMGLEPYIPTTKYDSAEPLPSNVFA